MRHPTALYAGDPPLSRPQVSFRTAQTAAGEPERFASAFGPASCKHAEHRPFSPGIVKSARRHPPLRTASLRTRCHRERTGRRGSQAGIREVDRAIRAAERRTAQPPHGNKKGMSAVADIPSLRPEDRLAAISVRTKPASHRGCCRRHRPRNAPDPKPASRRRAYISGPPA